MSMGEIKIDSLLDSENASLDYQAAGKMIRTKTAAWKTWYDSEAGEFEIPLTAWESGTIRTIVEENGDAISREGAARGKKAGAWGDHLTTADPVQMLSLDFMSSRMLADLLRLAAYDAHVRHHDDQAVLYLRDLVRLAAATQNRPGGLVGHLFADGIGALASDTAGRLSPEIKIGPDGAERGEVAALIVDLCDERSLRDGRLLGWRTERIANLNGVEEIVKGVVVTPQGGQRSTGSTVAGFLGRPFLFTDARLMADDFQGIMAAGDAADWPTAQGQLPKALEAAIEVHPIIHLYASIFSGATARATQVDYRAMAERRLAVVALAARLYALDHLGRLPANLEELTPRYLPSVPIDPLSGVALRYVNDVARPRIYSVGEDGVDDGGTEPNPYAPGSKRNLHTDIVVNLRTQPRLATQP
jgi:hypothetical protein